MPADRFADLHLDGVAEHPQLRRATNALHVNPSRGVSEHPLAESSIESSEIISWSGCGSSEGFPPADCGLEDSPVDNSLTTSIASSRFERLPPWDFSPLYLEDCPFPLPAACAVGVGIIFVTATFSGSLFRSN